MSRANVYDVAIVGAGPAGATCALALKDSGLRFLLLDKAAFPRDKVCGDAIPARCAHVLRALDPRYAVELEAFPRKTGIKSCRIVAPNTHHFDYEFHTGGYCSARIDFDQFLLELALRETELDFEPEMEVREAIREGDEWKLVTRTGAEWRARAIVACDGGQSRLARQLTGREMDPRHHCAAVRAYYQGVANTDPDRMEIHFLDDFLPGYFWIFPLPNDTVNVGFGMLSDQLSEKKLNLRKSFPEILASAGLRERFAGATELSGPKGFGLPMGSRKVPLSGKGFLLCGDAAALIEPATGEGIGNAMLSGQLAARTLRQIGVAADAAEWKAYDEAVYGKLWTDLRRKYLAQRWLGQRKHLMNWLVRSANRKGPVRWLMRKVF